MKNKVSTLLAVLAVILFSSSELAARGGRGGGGGGSRGGGGARSAPSRTPSASRPNTSTRPTTRPSNSRPSTSRPGTSRPSTPRPGTGTRPNVGTRPNTGTRPSTGTRPTQGQLNNFLDPAKPTTGRPGTRPGSAASGGGGAAAFLKNQDQRPGAGKLPNAGARPGQRLGAESRRPGDGERLAGNRPDRYENRGERNEQRQGRRDEVRDQFQDHHPRYDFWKDNPNAARWRWNRPYRVATWGLVAGWFSLGSGDAAAYDYGNNIYYDEGEVYYGEEAVASADEYAEQAQTLAESAPEVDDTVDWLPLGVFAITQDGEKSGPPPTLFVQLAVNKQGIIAGTFQNTATEKSQPIEGMVGQKNQRVAWTIVDKNWPVMETGLSNLTKDTAAALVHFEDGQTQQWLLVRMEEPKEESAP